MSKPSWGRNVQMCEMASKTRSVAVTVVLSAAAVLGGCSGIDGVDLQGPGFERLGLTGNKNRKEKKVPDRAPLLIPPNTARLPEPKPSTAVATARPDWPTDPDAQRKSEEIEQAAKQKKYEDKGDWSPDANIDEFEKLSDPMSRKRGIFSRGRALGPEYRTESQNTDDFKNE